MEFKRMLRIAETHTAGNPTRHVLQGVPTLPGETMADKMHYFAAHYDAIRRTLTMEPRGSACMSGVVYTAPCNGDADIGAFFFEPGGYLGLCGHSLLAAVRVIGELGMVPAEKAACACIDTPAGLIRTRLYEEDGLTKAAFTGAPSFLYDTLSMETNYGRVAADVAYGGAAYLVIDADALPLPLTRENLPQILAAAADLYAAAQPETVFHHPLRAETEPLHGVFFYKRTTPLKSLVAVVSLAGGTPVLDRSPCGAGTSARLAAEYAHGRIKAGEALTHRTLIDTVFSGRVAQSLPVGGYAAILPEVSGSAFFTGFTDVVLEAGDCIADGFIL